jgi:hypothetical protein
VVVEVSDDDDATSSYKALTAEYTAALKAKRIAEHKCVDCTRRAKRKPDGTYFRKCAGHLEYDRARFAAKRSGKTRKREREYVRRSKPLLTRAERRRAYQDEGRCACGLERDTHAHDRNGEVLTDNQGRPVLAKSCSRCLGYARTKRMHGGKVPVYCTSCQAHGFHRDDCSTLKE